MLVVLHGREKVRGSRKQPEQTHSRHLPQHPCPSTGLPGASGLHPAPILTAPAPSEELVAPPCPRQKVWLNPQSLPGEAQALHGDASAAATPQISTNLHPILFNGPVLFGFLILKAPFTLICRVLGCSRSSCGSSCCPLIPHPGSHLHCVEGGRGGGWTWMKQGGHKNKHWRGSTGSWSPKHEGSMHGPPCSIPPRRRGDL